MSQKEKASRAAITMSCGEPPELGEEIFEKPFPSNASLVTPLVVRTVEFLESRGLVDERGRNKVGVCLEEGLRNAVIHGNGEDFSKSVRLSIHEDETMWAVRIEDDGEGFALGAVPDPEEDDSLWGEGGRGLGMISLYASEVFYYRSGRVLLIRFDRR